MRLSEILVNMIYKAKESNYQPVEIMLGRYMFDELKSEVDNMLTMDVEAATAFMSIKIKISDEYKYLIGLA